MRGRRLPALTWAAAAALVFLGLAAGDLALRSRAALREARRHEFWRDNPAEKLKHLEARFAAKAGAAGPEAERAAALQKAEKDFFIAESSAKMAYVWYKTAAGEFRLPWNPWAAEARKSLPQALARWEAELAAAGIKHEPWMTR
ncbi:MAG: hypothetical protein NDI60_10970 [Elusimicrobiales bacterium]|nr:hypothetical protein [Elusimicrobiales bacterium]